MYHYEETPTKHEYRIVGPNGEIAKVGTPGEPERNLELAQLVVDRLNK